MTRVRSDQNKSINSTTCISFFDILFVNFYQHKNIFYSQYIIHIQILIPSTPESNSTIFFVMAIVHMAVETQITMAVIRTHRALVWRFLCVIRLVVLLQMCYRGKSFQTWFNWTFIWQRPWWSVPFYVFQIIEFRAKCFAALTALTLCSPVVHGRHMTIQSILIRKLLWTIFAWKMHCVRMHAHHVNVQSSSLRNFSATILNRTLETNFDQVRIVRVCF